MRAFLLLIAGCWGASEPQIRPPVASSEPDDVGTTEVAPQPAQPPAAEPVCLDGDTSALSPVEQAAAAQDCLTVGRFDVARTLADTAHQRAPDDATTAYTLARILLAQRQHHDGGCDVDAYLDTIVDLTVVAAQDPAHRQAILSQRLFAETRTSLRYRVATGVDLSTATDAQLVGVRLFAPATGAFGSPRRLTLGPSGVATYHELWVPPDGNGTVRWVQQEGTWRVGDGTLHLLDGNGHAQALPLSADGRLDDGSGHLPEWIDVPSECEA